MFTLFRFVFFFFQIPHSFAVLHWNWAGRRKEVSESAKSTSYLNEQIVQKMRAGGRAG